MVMEEKSHIKYSIKKNFIYHGDSLSILKTIPSNSVDLVFAAPPYNLQLKNKLGGDRITLKVQEFSNKKEAENICQILSSIDGISQIIINESQGFSINFVADKEKDLLTKLKVELAFSKFEIFSLTQSQPSLDDVYLQATGKTLLDAEISMAGKRDLKKESKQSMR